MWESKACGKKGLGSSPGRKKQEEANWWSLYDGKSNAAKKIKRTLSLWKVMLFLPYI
jgi:hypothetical protein